MSGATWQPRPTAPSRSGEAPPAPSQPKGTRVRLPAIGSGPRAPRSSLILLHVCVCVCMWGMQTQCEVWLSWRELEWYPLLTTGIPPPPAARHFWTSSVSAFLGRSSHELALTFLHEHPLAARSDCGPRLARSSSKWWGTRPSCTAWPRTEWRSHPVAKTTVPESGRVTRHNRTTNLLCHTFSHHEVSGGGARWHVSTGAGAPGVRVGLGLPPQRGPGHRLRGWSGASLDQRERAGRLC